MGRDLNAVYKDTYTALKPKYVHWVIFDDCLTVRYDRMTSAHLDSRPRRSNVESARRLKQNDISMSATEFHKTLFASVTNGSRNWQRP